MMWNNDQIIYIQPWEKANVCIVPYSCLQDIIFK